MGLFKEHENKSHEEIALSISLRAKLLFFVYTILQKNTIIIYRRILFRKEPLLQNTTLLGWTVMFFLMVIFLKDCKYVMNEV